MDTPERLSETCEEDDAVGGRVGQAAADPIDDRTATDLARTFKALSDPTRVRILHALSHDELCVHELASHLQISQSAVSHQLRTLREMRLVRFRKEGRHAFYTLDDDHVGDLFRCGLEHVEHD